MQQGAAERYLSRMSASDLLFVGTKRHVRAIRKADGREIWSTKLPAGSWGDGLVTLLCEEGMLFAAAAGHLFALDAARGEILWHNELQGLGYHAVILATASQPGQAAAPHAVLAAQAAAVAATIAATSAASSSSSASS